MDSELRVQLRRIRGWPLLDNADRLRIGPSPEDESDQRRRQGHQEESDEDAFVAGSRIFIGIRSGSR